MPDAVEQAPRRSMFPPQRQEEILRLTRDHGQVDVAELAAAFDVTTETIRRDLKDLQRRRLVRRVHGGAIPWDSGRVEPLLADRDVQQIEEKRRIAELAVQELPPEGVVMLDSGSTIARVAERLPTDSTLTIVTNSLVNAEALKGHEDVRIVVLGGEMERNTLTMADAQTVTAIRELTVDTLVLGTDGISAERGLTTPYRHHAEVKRAMITAARRVIAVADRSKVGTDHFIRFSACADIDTLITDTGADADAVAAVEAAGTTVMLA